MQITIRSSVIGGIPGREARGTEQQVLTVRSSVKPSSTANDNLIDRTIELWRQRLQHDLSREDARQIVKNVTGFFTILAEWSQAEMTVSETPASSLVREERVR